MAAAVVASPQVNGSLAPLAPIDMTSATAVKNPMRSPKSKISGKSPVIARGRRERPCDACRKRKSKCVISDGRKNCAACGVHGQECTFVEEPQPRKRRVDSEGTEAEAPKRSRSAASFTHGVLDTTRDSTIEHGQTLHKVEIEPSPQASGDGSRTRSRHYGTHIGPTTELEPILLDLATMDGEMIPSGAYRKADSKTSFLTDQISTERTAGLNTTALKALDRLIGSYNLPLIRVYMSTIHPNFPIIEQDFFSDCRTGRRTNVDPALLAALYTVTIPWLIHESSRPSSPFPDVSQTEEFALRLFGDSLCKPTLSTVQAGLLLMQRPDIDSRSLNTQLVAIAHELGLHLDCTSWTLSATEKGLRRRLAWALYMQDKWCSLIHGRPSAIFQNNWAVQGLADEDFDAHDNTIDTSTSTIELERGRALLKQMVHLTEILSSILDTFFTLRAMKEIDDAAQVGTRLILERAKPVQIQLKDWFARLPANLKMDSTMTSRTSSTGYLHLAYFATEITLHRCIIRSLEQSIGDSYLSHICRSAAKTRLISAMDFVNRLRTEHLNAFWYFPSKVNFALIGTFGSLLLATAPCREEAEFYRTRLSEYRWTLGVSSKSIGFLSFAIDSLDTSSDLLTHLPGKPSISEVRVQSRPKSNMQSASPPHDEMMVDAPDMHLGRLPNESTGQSSTVSGLVSPSTSTSSGSTTYEAYVGAFPTHNIGS